MARNIQRRVVCSAMRLPDSDLIFAGARHCDITIQRQLQAAGMIDKLIHMEQGFIDQWGVFMDRQEAMDVAMAASQPVDIKDGCGGHKDTLFSEGLY